MTGRERHRLLDKCANGHGLALDEMVARADGAAAKAIGRYPIYLKERLREIENTARRSAASWSAESWAAFGLAVNDVKNSAAMADAPFVFDYAQLLETVLWKSDRTDPQLDIVIRLFLSAIHAAADRSFDRNALGDMRGSLERIADLLGSIGWGSAKRRDF